MPTLPDKKRYVIIGAGIHGLSTAYHLAQRLKAQGKGSGEDIVVLDKRGPGAGASGIACGVVRNFYFQPAMGAVMRASVDIWEEHQETLHYHPVGYLALAGPVQQADLEAIYDRQQNSGYPSKLITGEKAVCNYMRTLFPDWKANGLTACLHELKGGYAFNRESVEGLLSLAAGEGVQVISGVKVTGFQHSGDRVAAVETDQGLIETDQVVVAVGPWVEQVWGMLGLPQTIDVHTPGGDVAKNQPMWTYWRLQEGEVHIDLNDYLTANGDVPPVIHVDSQEPLVSDRTGKLITNELWGVYFKRDRQGVQGGAVPENFGTEAQVDPYGTESPYYVVKEDFIDYWTSALAHCLGRFEGVYEKYRRIPSGGIGCFTVDSFPVFDHMLTNVYVIADSNHGYKMIGIGKEVADELTGSPSDILKPFRFARFSEGDLHPVSNSPYPWS